jgi:hypothetical protein
MQFEKWIANAKTRGTVIHNANLLVAGMQVKAVVLLGYFVVCTETRNKAHGRVVRLRSVPEPSLERLLD